MNALASFAGNFGSRKMSILEIFWCTVGVIIFVIVGTLILNAFKPSKTARGNRLRKLAKTLQFNSLGGGFPESFPKSRTWAADAQSFPFVAGGRRGPHEILFFDYLQKKGQQWTMIAIRSAAGRFPSINATSEFKQQVVDDWTIYRPNRQLKVEEIRTLIESIPD